MTSNFRSSDLASKKLYNIKRVFSHLSLSQNKKKIVSNLKCLNRVHTVMKSHEKSWNLKMHFPGLEKSWNLGKMIKVMEKS